MTGNFKEFKVENHSNETWNENNALASTAVCISLISECLFHLNKCLHDTIVDSLVSGLSCQH